MCVFSEDNIVVGPEIDANVPWNKQTLMSGSWLLLRMFFFLFLKATIFPQRLVIIFVSGAILLEQRITVS